MVGRFAGFAKKLAALAVLGLAVTTYSRAEVVVAYNQGWISESQSNDPTNNNTYAGQGDGIEYHDFFSFNLSGIASGSITSATLNLSGGYNYFTGTGTYYLYVSTIDPTTNPSGYAGLVAGDLIATVTGIPGGGLAENIPTSLTFNLNPQGLVDINAAAGGNFIVGGAFSPDTPDDSGNDAIFSYSDNNTNTLTVIPEASTSWAAWLAMASFVGIIFGRRCLTQ